MRQGVSVMVGSGRVGRGDGVLVTSGVAVRLGVDV